MKRSQSTIKVFDYQAPLFYVGLFYALLLAWTVASVLLLGSKTLEKGWPLGQLVMIAFVLAYTWYFSLGISYRMRLDGKGHILLTSFRRVLKIHLRDISLVQGPRFAVIPYGFIRFRLEREKAYLFSLITDGALQNILTAMRNSNRNVKFKGLWTGDSSHD
ncbi:MAG: hypothetical protein ABII06_08265 [Pseudomonadota bacterium]